MRKKFNKKQKYIIYILSKDEEINCTMTEIAAFFKVSQSTISNTVKEISHQVKVNDLSSELLELKQAIKESGMIVSDDFLNLSYTLNKGVI